MEVIPASPGKQLPKHAVPVVMVVLVVLTISAFALNNHNGLGSNTRAVLAKSLISPVIRIRPNPSGFSKVSFANPSPPAPTAGSDLRPGLDRAGLSAQLSISLQTPATGQ